jgi:hypothetical protein
MFADAARSTLVCPACSDRLIEGSPQNSVTAVPMDRGALIPVRQETGPGATASRRQSGCRGLTLRVGVGR